MKKYIVILLVMAALLIFIKYCPAHDPNAPKPLNQLIVAAPDDWKAVYGDTLETQVVYNVALMRNNQLMIGQTINNLHPPVDPNAVTLEVRLETLEKFARENAEFDLMVTRIIMGLPDTSDPTILTPLGPHGYYLGAEEPTQPDRVDKDVDLWLRKAFPSVPNGGE